MDALSQLSLRYLSYELDRNASDGRKGIIVARQPERQQRKRCEAIAKATAKAYSYRLLADDGFWRLTTGVDCCKNIEVRCVTTAERGRTHELLEVGGPGQARV